MHLLRSSSCVVAALALGCGGDVVSTPNAQSGGAGGTGPSAQASAGSGATSSTTSGGASAVGGSGQGGSGGCATDMDCAYGEAWCVAGSCVPCDNSGLACKLACTMDWHLYVRNGCHPCECAPPNACTTDSNCPGGVEGVEMKCYAGKFCWDWCPPGDPSCCYGNTCSELGCTDPNPTGCWTTGCPVGQTCTSMDCASSGCSCGGGSWACDPDCGGGTCH